MRYQPIENYGIIGDLHTVALVGMNGSIDFLCLPDFDSPSVFAAILDDQRGGRFRIAPTLEDQRQKQLYLPDSNVLLTRFLSSGGVAEVVDFMPMAGDGEATGHELIRRVTTVRGKVPFRMLCEPRFDYARADHRTSRRGGEVVFSSSGADGTALRLCASVPMTVRAGAAHAEFTLGAGQQADFILSTSGGGAPSGSDCEPYVRRKLAETTAFWRNWAARSTYRGRWRETVTRSALTLKLLFSRRHGSLVAAATFGLPERVGGERNWDYRYTWIRDSAFTLYALTQLGYLDEATDFMGWIEGRCQNPGGGTAREGPLQIMYGLDGRCELPEEALSHLRGYRGSAPVRVGNAAYRQLQLDIYGELMDAIYLFNHHGAPIAHDLWGDLRLLVDWVVDNWKRPDEGIWEVRGGPREFLYSRLMCWVALDRAMMVAWYRSFPAPLERWRAARDAIYRDIYENFWHPDRKCFVQYKGSSAIDASSLLMPMVRFISFTEPRWLSHLEALREELVEDSLVYRYRIGQDNPDGLAGTEGTFSMCSFWYVENLARAGKIAEARFYFEKMLGFANHVGLYSEELGPTGEHLGNYPQAFTHLALISAALALDGALSKAGWEV
jgi:GH15 family glucan-1,4-alpha-glucosidase